MTTSAPTFLATKNAHPRDKFITFDEGPHIYTVDGDSSFNMTLTDLKTVVENNLPIKIAVMNNSGNVGKSVLCNSLLKLVQVLSH